MPEIPHFTDGAYALETPNAACSQCINLYPTPNEETGKLRLRKIPGLSLFASLPTFPLRALWSNVTSCFAVSGGTLYQIFPPPTPPTVIGLVPNGTNPAVIASNGFQLAIASAGQLFIAPGGGAGTRPVVDITGAPVLATSVSFLDSYFVASQPNTKIVQISNFAPAGGTWDPADEGVKEAYSDNIVREWVDTPGGEYLWLFGNETTEIWANNAGLFPFGRIPSYVFSIGCDSSWAVAGVEGFRAWLWRGVIYGCSGFAPERISNLGVETAIQTYSLSDQQNAEAFAWLDRGHIFYAISFPQAGVTWVYDLLTKMWHRRGCFSNGTYNRYRPRVYARAFGLDLVGDYATGNVYSMSSNSFVDAPPINNPTGPSLPLRWQRICPYFTDSMKNDRYNRLTLDMDTGIGLSVPSTQVGYNPQVTMRHSSDRGKTWSNETQASLGKIGEDGKRVFFSRLGASQIGKAFDIFGTDPVPISINAAFLDIGLGHSPGNRPTS